MANAGLTLNSGSGGSDLAVDNDATPRAHQYVKIEFGGSGTQTAVTSGTPLPTDWAGTAPPIGAGTEAAALRVTLATDSTGVVSVDDNGGNLSVDWAGTVPPIGAGTEAAALRVTLATDSTGVVSIDDNGGTLTVDNTNIDNLNSSDFDSGAGTDTTPSIGIAVPASGGAAVITGDATNGLDVDVTRVGGTVTVDGSGVTQPVSGTVTANAGTGTFTVDLGANNDVTIDNSSIVSAVDTASGGTDAGVPVLVVRDDALTTLTPIDGDYTTLRVSSTGALHVTGGGGGTEYSEDAASPATIVGTATVMERDDALATLTPIEGDWAGFRCSAEGALWVQEFNSDSMLTSLQTLDNAISGSGFNITQLGGVNVTMGNGISGTGVQRVTIASDTTGVLSVDDNGGSLTVDNGGTFATQATLQAGTAEFGKLAAGVAEIGNVKNSGTFAVQATLQANSGVDIGDVDILSVVPGTAATNLGKAIDSASAGTDTGVASLAIRDDALSTLTPIEGDYVPLRVNSTGALHVTGGGGGTEYTLGTDTYTEATTIGSMAAAVRNDSLATLASLDNEIAPLQVNASGALYIQEGAALDVSAATVTVDGSGVTQPVSGTVTANPASGTIDTVTTVGTVSALGIGTTGPMKAEDIASANGDMGIPAMARRTATPADTSGADLDYEMLQMDNGRLWCSSTVTGTVTVDGSGVTQPVSGTVTANAGTGTMTVDLGANNDVTIDSSSIVLTEDAAHSSGAAGVMTLAVRNDDLAALAGTDGDYAPLQVTQNGALLSCPSANDDYKYAIIDAATSGNNTIQAAAGASTKIRVLAAFLVSAGTVNTRFESGADGTALTGQMNLVVNTGYVLPFNPGGWFETAANTLLNLELSAAISVDGCITYIEVV